MSRKTVNARRKKRRAATSVGVYECERGWNGKYWRGMNVLVVICKVARPGKQSLYIMIDGENRGSSFNVPVTQWVWIL